MVDYGCEAYLHIKRLPVLEGFLKLMSDKVHGSKSLVHHVGPSSDDFSRVFGPSIPRHARLCSHCSLLAVGDEKHFIYECPFLQPVRAKYQFLFTPLSSSMLSFFSQQNRLGVFNFVLDCLDLMNI